MVATLVGPVGAFNCTTIVEKLDVHPPAVRARGGRYLP